MGMGDGKKNNVDLGERICSFGYMGSLRLAWAI